MKQENNILMIAYYFPPLGGSGSLRPLKLAKYLPSFGWKPIILTVRNPDWYYASDPELLKELPPATIIKRAFMLRLAWFYRVLNPFRVRKMDEIIKRFLIHPDDQIGWLPFAYFSALDIVRKQNVKAVYSTSGPLTCHLIAYFLKKKTGIPWIADFRDEWLEAPNLNLPTSFHRRFHYRLEGMVVKNADKVITMAPRFCRLLSKHTTNLEKFVTITAGFDPEDFVPQTLSDKKKNLPNKFVIAFIGLFYDTFHPNAFVKALTELIVEGKISREKVKVKFVGANCPNDIDIGDRYEICEFTGFVPRKEAIQYSSDANALLLLLSKERGEHVIPSKVFEYLASEKPILALVPPSGEVANIIKSTNTGVVVDFEDVEGIKKAYLQLYHGWKEKENRFVKPNWEEIFKFDQKNLTEKLAKLLNDMAVLR